MQKRLAALALALTLTGCGDTGQPSSGEGGGGPSSAVAGTYQSFSPVPLTMQVANDGSAQATLKNPNDLFANSNARNLRGEVRHHNLILQETNGPARVFGHLERATGRGNFILTEANKIAIGQFLARGPQSPSTHTLQLSGLTIQRANKSIQEPPPILANLRYSRPQLNESSQTEISNQQALNQIAPDAVSLLIIQYDRLSDEERLQINLLISETVGQSQRKTSLWHSDNAHINLIVDTDNQRILDFQSSDIAPSSNPGNQADTTVSLSGRLSITKN